MTAPPLGAAADPGRDLHGLLVELVAAAATPAERAVSPAAMPTSRVTRGRVARWARAVAGTEDVTAGPVAAALAAGALGTGDPYAAFADLDPARISALPSWAQHLRALLAALPQRSGRDARLRGFGHALGGAIAALATADLAGADLAGGGEPVAEPVVAQIAAQWFEAVGMVTGPSIDFELRFLRAEEMDGSRRGWCERLAGLPVLGYLMGTVLRQRRAATVELLGRLAADRPLICAALFDGRDPGPLTGLAGGISDSHDGGRSVAMLTFASGDRVLYKPRDLRCFAAYRAFVAELGAELPGDRPHLRPVLVRDGYGWDAHVSDADCAQPDALPRYVRRLGHLVRIATLLDGRDLWQDNLVAHGDLPVLVDLETLLHPRLRVDAADRDAAVFAALEETALPTALVTAPLPVGHGKRAVDTGGACPAGRVRTPYRPDMPRLALVGRDLRTSEGAMTWRSPNTMASCGGHTVDPRSYADDLMAGYVEAGAAAARAATRLCAPGGAAHGFDGGTVRVMWSSTWASYGTLRASIDPAVLTDVAAREAALVGPLRRELAAAGDRAARQARLRIAAAEVHDLRQMDIPMLRHVVGTGELRTSAGAAIHGLVEGDEGVRLRARLADLAAGRPAAIDDVAVLRSCQQMIEHHTDFDRRVPDRGLPGVPVSDAGPSRAELLERAERIATLLWDAAVRVAEGPRGWVALAHDPRHDLLTLRPAPVTITDGLAGLLVMIAEVAAALGGAGWDRRAGELAAELTARLRVTPPGPGVFGGHPGALHALRRTRALLGHPAAHPGADLPVEVAEHACAMGDVDALIGTLLAEPWLAPGYATRLAEQVAARAAAGPAGRSASIAAPAAGRPYSGVRAMLPTGAELRALAVERLPAVARVLPAAAAARPTDHGRPAFWRVGRPTGRPAWTPPAEPLHGLATGELLAGGELAYAVLTAPVALASDIDRERTRAHLAAVAAELTGRDAAFCGYLPDRRGADIHQLSVLDGLPAVALALLRAAGCGCACVPLLECAPRGAADRHDDKERR